MQQTGSDQSGGEHYATATLHDRHEVVALLSKAGCNMGACHGNLNGKWGFRLSLRGDDPAADLSSLARDASGRRVDLIEAD